MSILVVQQTVRTPPRNRCLWMCVIRLFTKRDCESTVITPMGLWRQNVPTVYDQDESKAWCFGYHSWISSRFICSCSCLLLLWYSTLTLIAFWIWSGSTLIIIWHVEISLPHWHYSLPCLHTLRLTRCIFLTVYLLTFWISLHHVHISSHAEMSFLHSIPYYFH